VILVDRDNEDCHQLKQKLEDIAVTAGFITKSSNCRSFQVLNRIMVEELEAWFFGDIPAIIQAYPGIKSSLAQQEKYRDPDAIQGGTWEALERVLRQARYYQGGLDKPKAAREIAEHMNPETNRSKSFQVFYDGLRTWQNRALD
jgi:elongation factor P--beta-lysine ligase